MLQGNSPVLCYSTTHVQLKCTNIQCTCMENVYHYACPYREAEEITFLLLAMKSFCIF